MTRLWSVMAVIAILAGCQVDDGAQQADKAIDAVWQARLDNDPLYASYVGDTRGRDRLPDISAPALSRQDDLNADLDRRLAHLDLSGVDAGRRATVAIAHLELAAARADYRFGAQRLPLQSGTGLIDGLASLGDDTRLKSETEARDYIARLEALPTLIDAHLNWLREGLAQGFTQPDVAVAPLAPNADRLLKTAVEKSSWYTPLTQLPSSMDVALQAELRLAASTAIRQGVYPAIARYRDFMANDYLPKARTSLAISDLPGGADYYASQIAYYTTTSLSAEEIHTLGESEVERIGNEMTALLKDAGIKATPAEYAEQLRHDPQYVAASPLALLEAAAYRVKRAEAALPRLFHREFLPRTPLAVEPVPDFMAPAYTTGRYAEAANDEEPGTFWVNTYDLPSRPLYELPALALHEGTPGHHLQISVANEQSGDIPPLRRHTYLSAFGEGWALYAERLGSEIGYYDDVASKFGRLSYEMWRACRLVIDTGIHQYGWDRQRAIDYLSSHTALSQRNVETEVDRYIGWPGQALAYKVGELTIVHLRQEAETVLGARFDVRDFHEAVLAQGAVPLSVLEGQVHAYIEAAQTKATP